LTASENRKFFTNHLVQYADSQPTQFPRIELHAFSANEDGSVHPFIAVIKSTGIRLKSEGHDQEKKGIRRRDNG
jgi:hypothetical protein